MKRLILIFWVLFYSQVFFAQEKSIIGTWNTVSVSNDIFKMNEKKEIQLTEKGKIFHKSKDAILNLKLSYSQNQFIFTENKDFYVKLSENSKFFVFKGKYTIDEKNGIIHLVLTNNAGTELKKYLKYSFENHCLKLDVYFSEEPTKYILKRK